MDRETREDIKKYTNEDGTTNWDKLESGEAHGWFRFERIGQVGYGAIESQNGKWYAIASNGTKTDSREITKEKAIATIEKIKSQPSVFKVVRDFSANI